MGYDVGLRPERGNVKKYKEFLKGHNFKEYPSKKEGGQVATFYFFEHKDFLSVTGFHATIYQCDESKSGYEIHFRATYSASYHDVFVVNSALRDGRKMFGGHSYGDYGKNRYIPLEENDESTPLSRGLSFVYQKTHSGIDRVLHSIPESVLKPLKRTGDNDHFVDYLESIADPTRYLYSALVPYAVSAVEYFFTQVFQILLKYDPSCQLKVENYSKKVDLKDVILISRGEKTIEAVIAGEYSFQNLKSINKAFNQWFGVDIKQILYKKKKVNTGFLIIDKRMEEIIEFRHGVIHRFEVDEYLKKNDLIAIFKTVKIVFETISSELEKKYSITIERD